MTEHERVRQPGDREVAPGRLALVQSFVNSVNIEFGPDEFASAAGLARWMERHGFATGAQAPSEAERLETVEAREALRALMRENNGGEAARQARAVLERVAVTCPLVLAFDETGAPGLSPGGTGTRGLLGQVLAIVVEAASDGSWQRLKACREHRCEWAFYDRARNRGGRWCSMAVCGSRSKMQTYRQGLRLPAGAR